MTAYASPENVSLLTAAGPIATTCGRISLYPYNCRWPSYIFAIQLVNNHFIWYALHSHTLRGSWGMYNPSLCLRGNLTFSAIDNQKGFCLEFGFNFTGNAFLFKMFS